MDGTIGKHARQPRMNTERSMHAFFGVWPEVHFDVTSNSAITLKQPDNVYRTQGFTHTHQTITDTDNERK